MKRFGWFVFVFCILELFCGFTFCQERYRKVHIIMGSRNNSHWSLKNYS